jgi:hypothetical protein
MTEEAAFSDLDHAGEEGMPRTADSGFDAAFVDKENHAVGLVQVKSTPLGDRWASILPRQLERYADPVDFVLTIDPQCIYAYRPTEAGIEGPIVHLNTPEILRHYDPSFPTRQVFEPYLLTLAEAWLRDLAYHWKSENPPGSEELRRAGLLEKLEGGTTQPLGA